ncbi:uncharacterized protein LOC129589861 [Paramacrobiotus metropolitanus]|uniref:uncharacterized protein LOC129589861 n=1 Tax=Paramacrobiotus metropolitanus TaxID=2943436 RepID=UPI002445B3A8|nr:uncharacterized protein LOC129589861 [Paramacrobiotus metropolitanus]
MDLSRPFGDSVNDSICQKTYSMKFCSVDDAVRIVTRLGKGALMAKMDLKHAFRLIPVHPDDWHLLGYSFDNKYYFDVVLPFGCRSSPAIFDRMASFVHWIIVHVGKFADVLHYMDDFFFAGVSNSPMCRLATELMAILCQDLGVPLAPEKTEGPSAQLTFLGICIDSESQTLSIPASKVQELQNEFVVFSAKTSCCKRDLLSLIGKLSFATKCIPAGRIFLRRMIDTSLSVKDLRQHVTLSREFHADLQWWIRFLPLWNGTTSFIEPNWTDCASLQIFTDACGSGCGAIFGCRWFYISWPDSILCVQPHITWLEMAPIFFACSNWGSQWHGKRLTFFTDNQAVSQVWAKFSCKHSGVMDLVRAIHFEAARHNFHIRIKYLPGCENLAADALSRHEMVKFFEAHKTAFAEPDMFTPDFPAFLPTLIGSQRSRRK